MLRVYDVARQQFGGAAEREPFASSSHTFDELRRMPGKAKVDLLKKLGVTEKNILPFLRAMQHCASYFVNATVDPLDTSIPFPARSGHGFSHLAVVEPLTGYYDPISQVPSAIDTASPSSPLGTNRTSHGAVGLKNQGATCYLNSLLHALFHIVSFRHSVYHVPVDDTPDVTIPLALQALFSNMESSETACETTTLTKSFGWTDAEAFYQQDISELCTLLLDNLSEKLIAANLENFVKQLFYGVSRNCFVVPELNFEKKLPPEEYHALTLVVKGCSNIYQSLDKLVEPDILTGSNKYCLEQEGKKAYHDARREFRFDSLPPVLLVNMMRNEYDVVSGSLRKVMSRWEYYDHINLGRYISGDASKADYSLHAVLVHSGHDARHGHYYSFVRVHGKWLKFNDETVEEAKPEQVFGENFGGTWLNYWGSVSNQAATAYMLVYIRTEDSASLLTDTRPVVVPEALRKRLIDLRRAQELVTKEKAEAHKFIRISVLTEEALREHPFLLRKPSAEVEIRRVEKHSTLSELGDEFKSFWTFNLRESSQLHIEKRLMPSLAADEVPVPFAHCPRTVLALKFDAQIILHHKFYSSDTGEVIYVMTSPVDPAHPRRIRDMEREVAQRLGVTAFTLDVALEETELSLSTVDDHQVCSSGEVLVWFEPSSDPRAHYHFLRHRVQIRVHSADFRKGWPKLATLELADDATYFEVQVAVAKAIGAGAPAKNLRFSKHNLETGCPHPQRLAAMDSTTLKSMLTTTAGVLTDRIYCDVCEFPATEADQANYCRFEYFSPAVKYLSTHGIILPPQGSFSVSELLEKCRTAAKIDAKVPVRFVDTWKGRIYATYQSSDDKPPEAFQPLADYRVEEAPQRVDSDEPQRLINVSHISRTPHGFVAHSDPFSIWILESDTVTDVQQRIAKKLQLPRETVQSWKPAITYKKELIEIDEAINTLWEQFLAASVSDANKLVLSLEHTPLPGTRANTSSRREEGIKIRN
jgi:ubiquitin C-terminal hydrolase